jgi:single-strand DNA-binding protein
MNNLNSILVEGNLVRTPEIRETAKGTPVCALSIAVNRWHKPQNEAKLQNEVSFFDVEAWSDLALSCNGLEKGRGIRIVGRLKQNRWLDSAGKSHAHVFIIAEHIEAKPAFLHTAPPQQCAEPQEETAA